MSYGAFCLVFIQAIYCKTLLKHLQLLSDLHTSNRVSLISRQNLKANGDDDSRQMLDKRNNNSNHQLLQLE